MTHDYLRNGITTLFAALNVLDDTVLGRCMQRHRHQEFLRFLNAIEAAVPAGKVIHVILDNYGAFPDRSPPADGGTALGAAGGSLQLTRIGSAKSGVCAVPHIALNFYWPLARSG
jgi:hypothetical protein